MNPVISIQDVVKSYASGLQALKPINLDIDKGEIFALLGPNGAGKTTLINIICGIVVASAGTVLADGHDIVRDYRAARTIIGLVPQELSTDAFETVWATVSFSRGLFGRAPNPGFIERLLRDLSLWDKRDSRIMTLSGGMKRRVMIAKALSHEPQILFLDEPTAGVDVELRRDMWILVRGLRDKGVTIILTTHYIEEAEEMADRIGVINRGSLVLVEEEKGADEKTRQETIDLAPARTDPKDPRRTEIVGSGTEGRRSRPRVHRRRHRQHRHIRTAQTDERIVDRGQGSAVASELARGYFREVGEWTRMIRPRSPFIFNRHGVWAIYKFEIARSLRTLVQSLVTPVITTSLYFVVFGAAIGSRLSFAGGVSYGAFIVPGLIMLALFTESLSNASFGIYFPKFTGTIYELLSAPVSYVEIIIAYVGAASTKSVVLGLTILATASLFVPIQSSIPPG